MALSKITTTNRLPRNLMPSFALSRTASGKPLGLDHHSVQEEIPLVDLNEAGREDVDNLGPHQAAGCPTPNGRTALAGIADRQTIKPRIALSSATSKPTTMANCLPLG